MPPKDIAAFEGILAAKLYALDTREQARWCYRGQSDPDNDDYISSGGFLYSRCVVVANGREFFEHVLADPSNSLPRWSSSHCPTWPGTLTSKAPDSLWMPSMTSHAAAPLEAARPGRRRPCAVCGQRAGAGRARA